jgi:hypothetical protein
MGCMRLSTTPDRNEGLAIAILPAALDPGVDFGLKGSKGVGPQEVFDMVWKIAVCAP